MINADEVRRVFNAIMLVDKGAVFSPLARLLLLGLVAFCIKRRRIYVEFLAAYIGLMLIAAGTMAIGFQESAYHLIFAILFPLGLLWGRESLVLPPRPRFSWFYVGAAAALGLVAFFYPYYTKGFWGAVLFAPVGVLPASSLVLAQCAIIATRRSYSLYTVIPTWAVGAVFAAAGLLSVDKPSPVHAALDWVLMACVAASIALYFSSPATEPERKSKKLKRH